MWLLQSQGYYVSKIWKNTRVEGRDGEIIYLHQMPQVVLDTNNLVAKKKVVMSLIVVEPTNVTILRDLLSLSTFMTSTSIILLGL